MSHSEVIVPLAMNGGLPSLVGVKPHGLIAEMALPAETSQIDAHDDGDNSLLFCRSHSSKRGSGPVDGIVTSYVQEYGPRRNWNTSIPLLRSIEL